MKDHLMNGKRRQFELSSKEAFLNQFPLFNYLTQREREQLSETMELRIKPKYSFIYLADEPSDYVFFLAKGAVKVGTHSADGKEVIKNIIHPQTMFGELGLIGEKKRLEFARVLKEEVHVFAVKVEALKLLMRNNFDLCNRVMMSFGDRLVRAENKLESLIFKDARTRIIEFIKDSVDKRGRRVGFEMLLKHSLTHQDIANITCTSRQTVTLVLNELKKTDLIYFNRGKILVRDMSNLR